nr:hypothetical protein [Alteromonas macleodii]
MKQIKKSSVATALGAVVIGSLASTVAVADVNPFGMQALESGYNQFAAEGKCGEGKCGGDKAEKEGKCGFAFFYSELTLALHRKKLKISDNKESLQCLILQPV